jgi:hypothetical protein
MFVLAPFVPAPYLAGQDPQVSSTPNAFGLGNQLLEMPATLFAHSNIAGSVLVYDSGYFFNNPASATPRRFFAAIPLPGGSRIFQIECHVGDSSAANNVTLTYQRWGFDTNADTPVTDFSRIWATSGAAGYQDVYFLPNEADGTIVHGEGSTRYTYYLTVDVASDTSFRGCQIGWRRLVSPEPATASFPNDVPTNHPYFRFVEALVAAGVTSGCAPQAYCPNQPVTRGEMAVFLAAALGLHFPF